MSKSKVPTISNLILCMLMLVISLFFVSCSSKETNKLQDIINKNKLVIGTSADYPPFEFPISDENSKESIVGLDIDIANEIAKDLGVELEIKNMDFSGLLDALKSNKVDIVISGMSPDETRSKQFTFSEIYFRARNKVIVKKENAELYKSKEDFVNKNIGVQMGSIQEKIANLEFSNSNIKSLSKTPDLILELKSDRVDGIIMEEPVASLYIKSNPELAISEYISFDPKDFELGSAIAVNKGQTELIDKINQTISRLISENKIDEFLNNAIEKASKSN